VLDSLATALAAELRALADADRLRALPPLAGPDRTHPLVGDRPLLSFCSNDYLGLANHPALLAAARSAAERSGFGAGAARLVSGDLPEHRELEAALAAFVGTPAALLFPTGYQTNIGVLSALASRDDLIVSDAANHASLIDGCRLSRAEIAVYPHRDASAARSILAAAGRRHRRRLLVTESLFSMDGDTAPLADLARAAHEHDAALIVDEAHALGVAGPGGAGLCRAAGVTPDVLVGTLGKALGSLGGFAAGSTDLRSVLLNRARTFIFTTSSPAPVVAAAAAALGIITTEEGAARRQALQARISQLRSALGLSEEASPIVPVILGSDRAALDASSRLRAAGLFVQAIRPPTVPEGTARLRVTLSAAHTAADVEALAAALHQLGASP
jgi:8-amino-7-oxononanoate synthase